jgi:hypothetical protein
MTDAHPPFPDQWPNQKVARVVSLALKGATAGNIAKDLNDGTRPGTIRKMLKHWGIGERHTVPVPIELHSSYRQKLFAKAREMNTDGDELARRLITVIISDQMYGAVLDED